MITNMRIISRRLLKDFWSNPSYKDSEQPLKTWFDLVKEANWETPAHVKKLFSSASVISNNRIVFNIGGNKYRLIVAINYKYKILYIRFIGTHKQYDNIDVKEI